MFHQILSFSVQFEKRVASVLLPSRLKFAAQITKKVPSPSDILSTPEAPRSQLSEASAFLLAQHSSVLILLCRVM